MAIPANVRVNVTLPFPALVQGSGPIGIAKVNGIWTVSLSTAPIATVIPAAGQYPTDFFLLWDSVNKVWVAASLTTIIAASASAGSSRLQRSITSAPAVTANDSILNLSLSAPATISLPTAASRAGFPLTINDANGSFGTSPVTLTPNGVETINGLPSIVLREPNSVISLMPYNDSVNAGWFIL